MDFFDSAYLKTIFEVLERLRHAGSSTADKIAYEISIVEKTEGPSQAIRLAFLRTRENIVSLSQETHSQGSGDFRRIFDALRIYPNYFINMFSSFESFVI